MAEVSGGGHSDIGPELRRLAQTILDGIDPAVRAAAALTAGAGVGTGKCQQVWCPVCALAALATGDQHPLLTAIADHSIALLEVIRDIVNDIDRSGGPAPEPPPDGPPGGGPGAPADAASRTRYQPIPVTLEE
ncbi:hypothetical protein A5659_12000 [Mycobacterium sp. 1165196.3]|uniref:hypothetical protein n=2 Tax=Mycobacterium TaxID=1763 RepID=UPI00080036E9|nr:MULTISPECIES: hypothetical protein [unclassified Mycobacterium]OBJ10639.1 hypothetical protein A5624_14965 [Mycobacterium sp. 1482292.6]OBJ17774.1 hypothetical protein A5622_22960 [Mycobacterium sp. 1245801.1]OBJ86853.1 hypothetical protein A9W96_25025 [Mycobacterium sp. 1245852.3]OBK39711.1 hypothetical protein A5659_12000 [Mycobacterium sp. 1165196.3]